MSSFDTVIIGGGIIGCALARSLARAGMKVAVVERGALGEEASWAAAGMLSPSSEAEKESPLFALCRASLQLYGQWVPELESETGIETRYRTEGTLLLYENEQQRREKLPSMEWQMRLGIPIQELSSKELQEREPELADLPGAFYLPQDYQIDNRLFLQALVESCRRLGVAFVLGEEVSEVESDGRRATGVGLKNGKIAAGKVVNAAGSWAGMVRVPGLPAAPMRPVKGHMLAVRADSTPFRHVLRSPSGYLVPRQDGRVIIGSTMEEAGFDKSPRAGPLTRLLQAAQRLCPILEKAVLLEFWTGLRPTTPDTLPLLGPTNLDGYWVALGHFRNGILLAPITAQLLARWMVEGNAPLPVDGLLPGRFGL